MDVLNLNSMINHYLHKIIKFLKNLSIKIFIILLYLVKHNSYLILYQLEKIMY